MRLWYLLLLALPVMIGCNNFRAGGEFLPVFIAGLTFAMISIGSMEAVVFTHRVLRRQTADVPQLADLSHRAA
jgi:hypothetical protein